MRVVSRALGAGGEQARKGGSRGAARRGGWLLALSFLVLAACTPTRFLAPRENLLYQVKIRGVTKADPVALETLLQQRAQTTLPLLGGTPKLWFWIQGKRVYRPEKTDKKLARVDAKYDDRIRKAAGDSLRIVDLFEKRERRRKSLALRKERGNFLMRKLGEPPVIYDSLRTVKTLDQFQIFLASKGFFRGRAEARTELKGRKVYLTYTIHEGPESVIVQLLDSIDDPVIATIVRQDRAALASGREDKRLLREGDRYDADKLGQERTRLENVLKNRGYFAFRQQYVSFVADTTNPQQVRLTTIIANPPGAAHHTVYRLRRVAVIADADRNRFGLKRDTIVYDSVRYLAYQHRIRPWALDRKMALRPGQLYSPDRANRTQRQFTDLDLFRFVGVRFRKAPTPADSLLRDSLNGGVPIRELNALVSLSPQRKFQETTELGVTVAVNIPGPFGSERLRIRNVFRGGEVLDIGLRGALEGQYPFVRTEGDRGILSTQLGGNLSLTFPRVLAATPRFDRRYAGYNPRTRLTTSYTYISRDEYTRTNLELTYEYLWQRTTNLQYIVAPFDLSYIETPRINDAFRRTLEEYQARGFPLLRSFQSQIVPSMNLQRIYNSNDFAQTRDAAYSRFFLEVGGLTNLLFRYDRAIDKLGNTSLPVFSFAKLALDVRRYWKVGPANFLVGRFNGGVARSLQKDASGNLALFSFSNLGALPYDKYFFAGGPSSVRAWRPRRLGPGSYHQPDVYYNGQLQREALEQPGELLLEGNLEYRAPIFGYLKGALFVDAGNTWSLTRDDERPGARFDLKRFYREIAVGTGIGLRFDFSFLVFRLDAALRVYDPTVPDGESRYVLPKFRTAYNLGIGYPF